MSGAVLDAGALIAFERTDRVVVGIVTRAIANGDPLVVPAGVVAQTWRDGRRQARLARLLAAGPCVIESLDGVAAKATGQLLGVSRTTDTVDAAVVIAARRHGLGVVTSDPNDLSRHDPSLRLTVV